MTFLQTIMRKRLLWFTATLVTCLIVILHMPPPAQSLPLTSKEEHASSRRYCSTALFEAIRIICGGRYNSLGKRYPDSFGNYRTSTLKRLVPDDDIIYRPSFGGAAHECCRRPCGYSELQAYCAD
ncbi:probable insulin-like peptide 5 [Glossina fuscipes]|nr:probable insulin-like peptide 5 [Glossina fuscipes]